MVEVFLQGTDAVKRLRKRKRSVHICVYTLFENMYRGGVKRDE